MPFEFATPARIIFGCGVLTQITALAPAFGNKALVVSGRPSNRADRLRSLLARQNLSVTSISIPGEPTIHQVREGAKTARERACDLVIGFGGGSVMDAAKAIAALAVNSGEPMDYLEVVGLGKLLQAIPLPWIAIPTTAGTGSEVTRNSVLSVPERRVKASIRSAALLPKVALVDPELTLSLTPPITAQTGLDALTQLIEPFVSQRANPLTDALCREGIKRVARSLRQAYEHGEDLAAREDLALSSLLSGLALANAGLGAVHGFAAPIGGAFPAPHGAVCAALLAQAMEINVQALRRRQPQSQSLERYREIAVLLTQNTHATIEDGIVWIQSLCRDLHITGLHAYGISEKDFPDLIAKAACASSMKANPLDLTSEELRLILEQSL